MFVLHRRLFRILPPKLRLINVIVSPTLKKHGPVAPVLRLKSHSVQRAASSSSSSSSSAGAVYYFAKVPTWASSKSVRNFHTSSPRFIQPVILILLRPISKICAILLGRHFRKRYQRLTPTEKEEFWGSVEKNRRNILMGFISGLSITWLYYETHIEKTPITSRRRFLLFTTEQFDALSKTMFELNKEFYSHLIVPQSHPVHRYVSSITNRLISKNNDIPEMRAKTWSITIVDSQEYNAYVLPRGDIFVFGGMLEVANNEDQLGCILGHEMAHAVLGHSAELLSFFHLVDLIMVFVIAMVWAVLPTDLYSVVGHIVASRLSALLIELPYNRMLETEADHVGLKLAAKACFDIRESSVFWNKMSRLAKRKEFLDWFSTHPNHQKRAGHLDELIPQALKTREESNCPPLPAADPRRH